MKHGVAIDPTATPVRTEMPAISLWSASMSGLLFSTALVHGADAGSRGKETHADGDLATDRATFPKYRCLLIRHMYRPPVVISILGSKCSVLLHKQTLTQGQEHSSSAGAILGDDRTVRLPTHKLRSRGEEKGRDADKSIQQMPLHLQ